MGNGFSVILKSGEEFWYDQGNEFNEELNYQIAMNNFVVTKVVAPTSYLNGGREKKLWGKDAMENMLLEEKLSKCLAIVGMTFSDVIHAGPMNFMCPRKFEKANDCIAIVSSDALSIFWESRKRLNLLMLPTEEIVSITSGGPVVELQLEVNSMVVRRSPDAEMWTNTKIHIQPAISKSIIKNSIAFTTFMSYVSSIDRQQNRIRNKNSYQFDFGSDLELELTSNKAQSVPSKQKKETKKPEKINSVKIQSEIKFRKRRVIDYLTVKDAWLNQDEIYRDKSWLILWDDLSISLLPKGNSRGLQGKLDESTEKDFIKIASSRESRNIQRYESPHLTIYLSKNREFQVTLVSNSTEAKTSVANFAKKAMRK